MFPSSVRCMPSAASHSPSFSSLASSVPRPTVSNSSLNCRRLPQRRASSSKPWRNSSLRPSRDTDSTVKQSVQPSILPKIAQANLSGDKDKGPSRDFPQRQKLPRVPSTHNIPKPAFALASFFSLHRPISITQSVPRPVTEEAFASIFAPKVAKPSDVIHTLSRTIRGLEHPVVLRQGRLGPRDGDGNASDLSDQIASMSGPFAPYRVPSPSRPQPAVITHEAQDERLPDEALSMEQALATMDLEDQPKKRVWKAVFTVEELTNARGDVNIVAHSPEFIEQRHDTMAEEESQPGEAIQEPRTFLRRMYRKKLRFEQPTEERGDTRSNTMLTISVKRQRKLKMKKKKYKKLQKRLRNEARKLNK